MHATLSKAQAERRSWPVVVTGSEGSGTRVLVAILRAASVYMGTNVNPSQDARAFRPFDQKWLVPYIQGVRGETSGLEETRMARDFQKALDDHCTDLPDPSQPWGWKRIESIYLLPFLHQQLPGMVFIHMIRNGLDMAFSPNQAQVSGYGAYLLGRAYDHEPEPLRSLRLWIKANTAAADYAERHLGPRYLCLHYEALCARPVETLAVLFEFLALRADPTLAASLVTDAGTIGRWRTQADAKLLVRLLRTGEPVLRRFGYWDESACRELTVRVGPLHLALLPLENRVSRARHLLARLARAARERRLRSALRNKLVRWIR